MLASEAGITSELEMQTSRGTNAFRDLAIQGRRYLMVVGQWERMGLRLKSFAPCPHAAFLNVALLAPEAGQLPQRLVRCPPEHAAPIMLIPSRPTPESCLGPSQSMELGSLWVGARAVRARASDCIVFRESPRASRAHNLAQTAPRI